MQLCRLMMEISIVQGLDLGSPYNKSQIESGFYAYPENRKAPSFMTEI